MCLKNCDQKDLGLLVLRIGLGAMFMMHGYGKLTGGAETWGMLGQAMGHIGIGFTPKFFGLMATLSEFVGGFCLIIGLGTRIASTFLAFTMFIASINHLAKGNGLMGASHAIEVGVVFLSLILIGPGQKSVDHWLKSKCRKNNEN